MLRYGKSTAAAHLCYTALYATLFMSGAICSVVDDLYAALLAQARGSHIASMSKLPD